MGKSVRDGLGDPFAFKPEYNGQIRTATKQSPEQTPAANDSFSFKPEYNDTIKKKVGGGESSPTESPSPESINTAYQNFQNKSLTPEDVKTLQATQWGKENNITGIPEKAIPLFVEAHNGKTQDDLRTTMVNGVINQFYPPSQDLQQEAARKKITAQVLSGDQDAIQKVKGAVVQNIQKQIDDRENQINGGNSGDLGMARSVVAAFKDPVIKQLKEKINQVSGTIDQYGMNALVNSPDIKPFLNIDKNHPQLLTSVAASKVGKLIQEKYGLDNSSGNVEYERSKAGMAQIINNLSMEYNSTLKQAIISKNPELIKQAQEQAQNLSRYSNWYNKLDSEQFTDVGQQNTARFLGDVIAKKHPGKWIVTKSDVDEAAQQANTENPGWLDKYGKFLGPLKEHPMAVPAPGFGGALERGAVGAVYNLANLADYVLPKSVEHGAERQEDQSSAFFKGTSYSGHEPTKVVYDKNNKAYRELSNEHYGSIDWNNAFRFMGESVPGLMQWIAPEMAGADVAKGLGASEKAQRLIGLTTAAYLTGYDNNRKTADELITDTGTSGDAKKAVLANLLTFSTIAAFKALDYSPTKFVEQAIAKSAAPDALKILEGTNWEKLSQEQTESFLKDQVLPRAKAIVSKIGENALQGAKVGVATVADQKIKDLLSTIANPDKAKTSSLEDNMKTLVEQSLLMSVIGLPGVVKSGFQSPSMKDALYEAGNYAPQYIERVNNMLDAGQIDQAKANQMISIIKTIGEEVAKSKDVETEDELPITNQQRKEIVLANFRDRAAAKMKEDGATDVDHVNGEVKKQVKEIRSQNFYEDLQPQLDAIQKDRDAELKMSPEDQHNSINAKYDAEIVNLEQGKDYVSRGNVIENNNITKGLLRRGLENDNIDQEYAPFVDHPEHVFDYISKEIQDGKEAEMTKEFGKELVNRAQEKAQNDNYTEHVAPILKRINDADYINEKELDKSANVLYDVLDRVDKNEDLTPEQKQSIGNLIEPLITKIEGYDFRTKIETSHVTERIPTIVPTEVGRKKEIVPALEQSKGEPATVTLPSGETRKGTLNIKGGQYVIDVPGSEQIVIGEKAITDRDLKLPDENKVENPVGFDENGNVKSVTFETKNGNLVTIENPEKALDLAIQLRADAIGEVPQPEFDLVYKEVEKQISQERLVNEPVAIAEPNNSPPKIETNGNQESSQKNGPEEGGQSSQEGIPGESQRGQNDVLKNEGGEQPKGEAPPLTEPPSGNAYDLPFEDDTEDKRTGIKNQISRTERFERNLPFVEVPKLGPDSEILQEGKRLVDSGEIKPLEVVNRILEGKETGMQTAEAKAMQYYMHQLATHETDLKDQYDSADNELDKADINGQRQQLSDEMDRATDANIQAGKAWSDVGNIRQIEVDLGFNPSRTKSLIKDAYGGEIPKEAQKRIDTALKERDAAIEARNKAEERLKNEAAKKVLQQIKEVVEKEGKTIKKRQTKEEIRKDRERLLEDLKAAVKKDTSAGYAFPFPVHVIDAIGKLAISYFKEGYVTLEEMAGKVYDDIKTHFPGATKRDVRDAISKYDPLRDYAKESSQAKQEAKEKKAQNKLANGDLLDKKKDPSLAFKKDTEWVKANQRAINAEYALKVEKRKAFESKKNKYKKGLMWVGRGFRLSVLSGYNVLGKLAAAATIGGALKRVPEQTVGAIYSQVFKSIAKKAPIEGGANLSAELDFYKEFFNPKKFAKNSWEILKSGSSPLSKKFGGAEYEHIPGVYLPTDLHQIIKDPLKRATFEASFKTGMAWAERNGLDINDPLIIQSIENASYKRAQYEIFQESNALSRKFSEFKTSMEKKGDIGATGKFLADFMIPVSTVPTNIARRLTTTSPLGLIRGGAKVVEAYRNGIENLSNEQADAVMKQLKQGTLGTALWLIGWFGASSFGGLYSKFNPDKQRKEGDLSSDEMSIGDKMIPKPVQHALPLEIIQLAATMKHIHDNYVETKDANEAQADWNAALGSIGALAEQIPVIETSAHFIGAFHNPYEAKKLQEDAKRRFVPQILRETGLIKKKEE